MRIKSQRLLSTLLALTLVFSLFAAMPLTAHAETAVNLKGRIESFSHGGYGHLTAAVSDNTVTVTGSVHSVTRSLALDISSGVTILWKADYSGSSNGLVALRGSGSFEVAQGSLSVSGDIGTAIFAENDTIDIVVNGGTVSASGSRPAISSQGVVTINGGTVKNTGTGFAVQSSGDNALLKVNGGVVEATGSETISVQNMNFSGGAVGNTGTRSAIQVSNNLAMTGGMVYAKTGKAILADGSSAVIKVDGGFVFAHGTNTDNDVIGSYGSTVEIGRTAIVCAWNKAAGNTTYAAETAADLTATPGAVVKWGKSGSQSGIHYADSASNNTGFLQVSEITLTSGSAAANDVRQTQPDEAGNTTPDAAVKPTITGAATMTLPTGYTASSTDVYTVGGSPDPTVSKTSGDAKITWNSSTKKLDIAAGLTAGTYSVVLKAANGVNPDATFTFTLTVSNVQTTAPSITGTPTVIISEGYTATSSASYTVGGSPEPTVSKTSGDAKITWNGNTKKLDIAAGLTSGSYPVVLKAANGVNPDATITVTVKVDGVSIGAPKISGSSGISLPAGYMATSSGALTVTGTPTPKVTKESGHAAVVWNNSTKKLDIAAGLAAGSYPIVLKAVNGVNPDATFSFVITVTGGAGSSGSSAVSITGMMENFRQVNTYTSGKFTDVKENEWYGFRKDKVIARAYEYGLMEGNSATDFNPEGNITVAEAITIASRVNSIYRTGVTFTPANNPSAQWYQAFVDYAVEHGIITAKAFSEYDRTATRAEMALIFSSALPKEEFPTQNSVNTLPDVSSRTPHRDAIFMLYQAGILAGNDAQGTFNPGNNITRAEAAAIISRVILPDTRLSGRTFG